MYVCMRLDFLKTHFSSPVHSRGVSMQGCVPLNGQELYPADDVSFYRFLKVAAKELERHVAKVVH